MDDPCVRTRTGQTTERQRLAVDEYIIRYTFSSTSCPRRSLKCPQREGHDVWERRLGELYDGHHGNGTGQR